MVTYNVTWRTSDKTDEQRTLDEHHTGLTLQEVIDLAVAHDARAILRNEAGFTVGEVSPSGNWSLH